MNSPRLTYLLISFKYKDMVSGFFRILLYALFAYIIYLFIRFYQAIKKSSKKPSASKHHSGVMVKDEICNTYLPKEDAIKEIYEGKEYYFCSNECRQKFLETK